MCVGIMQKELKVERQMVSEKCEKKRQVESVPLREKEKEAEMRGERGKKKRETKSESKSVT